LPGIDHLLPFRPQEVQAEALAGHGAGSLAHHFADHFAAGNGRRPDVRLVETKTDAVERMNVDTFRKAWFVIQQPPQLGVQGAGQRVGEGRQQHPGIGMRAREKRRPMQGDDGLARSRRAGNPRRPGVVALDPLPLFGVQKDRPLFPRVIESALQFLDVAHDAEAALRVRMVEGVGGYRRCCRHPRFAARRQFQQGLGRLGRQMVGQGQQRVLGRLPDVASHSAGTP
jgi:hypothetical protein